MQSKLVQLVTSPESKTCNKANSTFSQDSPPSIALCLGTSNLKFPLSISPDYFPIALQKRSNNGTTSTTKKPSPNPIMFQFDSSYFLGRGSIIELPTAPTHHTTPHTLQAMTYLYAIRPTIRWLLAVMVVGLILSFAAFGRKKSLVSRGRINGNEEAGEEEWQDESSTGVLKKGRDREMRRVGGGRGRAAGGLDIEDSRVAM